jgi:hypothetical protein
MKFMIIPSVAASVVGDRGALFCMTIVIHVKEDDGYNPRCQAQG